MNLYNKYRPKEFDGMVSNQSEIESFKNMLKKENGPHVFLLHGPSGCGKTTLARIAAKTLGANELTTSEINSSNNRGIDTARQIITQMNYASSAARVFIIDEAHKCTNDWQNAMLKPFEDTPDSVYFFLCTTEPNKMIKALRNRCSEIKVATLTNSAIYKILKRICIKEGFDKSKDILEDIADNSNGSPRLAINLLEKISGIEDEKDMRSIISIGEETQAEIKEICKILLKGAAGEWKSLAAKIKELKEGDAEKLRYAVMGYMKSILLRSAMPRAAIVLECFCENFYSSGMAGFVLACYTALHSQ